MPLPCELPPSPPGNPSSLPGAIAALSAQVTSTLLEVRQEIEELKCEFVQVRGLAIQLASSLIDEQTKRLKLEFLNSREAEDGAVVIAVQLAISQIQQQTQKLKGLFNQRIEVDLETQSRQELLCALATSIIRNQIQIFLRDIQEVG